MTIIIHNTLSEKEPLRRGGRGQMAHSGVTFGLEPKKGPSFEPYFDQTTVSACYASLNPTRVIVSP